MFSMLQNHKFVIFGSDHYNTLGAVRSLGEAGIRPDLILHPHYREKPIFSNNSRFVADVCIVKTVEEGYRLLLNKYGNKSHKTFVYSCDDWVESCLDSHYDEIKEKFIFFHGSKQGVVSYFMNKDVIAQLANEHGLNVPQTEVVKRGEMPKTLHYPIITKSRTSTKGGWKEDVFICKSDEDLKKAYLKIASTDILLAEYIDKEMEFSFDAFSLNDGKDVFMPYTISCLRATPGNYGKYLSYSSDVDEKIRKSLTSMLEAIGFTGLFSADFLKGKDGKYYFLEINFRNSAFSYPVTYGGVNMLHLWASGMVGNEIVINLKHNNFKALVEIQDFKDYALSHKLSIFKWLYELVTADCLFYYNKRDTKPVRAYICYLLKKYLKKIIRL